MELASEFANTIERWLLWPTGRLELAVLQAILPGGVGANVGSWQSRVSAATAAIDVWILEDFLS
ncbi:MAG TPA: hypothetical protein DDZ51_18390 [Planctomycetaceae bacterium]|nr:hypothetical protein [Planctomycetaceae bacterium]